MKRFLAGIVFSLLISAAGVRAGQRMYEVGTVYIFLPSTSNEQIVRDLETMAATGINTVEICPSFLLTPGNPQPDFTKTDIILKNAERLGLRIMPTVFWSGLLPDYAEAKWPDRFSPIIDGEGREARLSYADPEVMKLIDEYSTLTVQHFKDSPSVIAYNIWDEPHMEGFPLSTGEGSGGGDPHFNKWFEEWGLKKVWKPRRLVPSMERPVVESGIRKIRSSDVLLVRHRACSATSERAGEIHRPRASHPDP